ncbi:hypothetical protein [Thioalkalivibrio sulfidiphilus]|nr:hypothetical protein [Thioalkalivibrio sulfidiphilus]
MNTQPGAASQRLTLPAAAVLAVLVRHAHADYRGSALYAGDSAKPGG